MEKGKILVVEDEAVNAMMLQMYLEAEHFEVCPLAGNAIEAVAVAEAHRPNLILMDINLPGEKTGIDAAKEIERRFGILSIFVSAYPKKDMEKALEDCRFVGYVTKPFEFADLAVLIRSALKSGTAG